MKVLLAVEGSEFGQAAIKQCCKMFDKLVNTEIKIISVVEPTFTPAEPFNVSADYVREMDAAAMRKATDVVAQAEAEVRKRSPDLAIALSTKVVTGSPKQAIVEEAQDWGADLIILGSHGYGFWQRALLGSVSNSVVHHAPCSVLVVRSPEDLNGKNN